MLQSSERIDPSRHNSLALLVAIQQEHLDVVRLLLEDSRVNPSLGTDKFHTNLEISEICLNQHFPFPHHER